MEKTCAVDASKAWDLRREIREKLITFVQKHFPQPLPRLRAEFERRLGASPETDSRGNPSGFAPSKS